MPLSKQQRENGVNHLINTKESSKREVNSMNESEMKNVVTYIGNSLDTMSSRLEDANRITN